MNAVVAPEIGDAIQTDGEVTFVWHVHEFLSLSDKVGDCYHSPVFDFSDSRWYLRLFPNGITATYPGWVGLFLMRKDLGPLRTVYFTLGIKGVVRRIEEEIDFHGTEGMGSGYPKFWPRSSLQDFASLLMPENIFSITCNMKCKVPIVVKVSLCNRVCKVSSKMKTILHEGKRADFTLKLGDREWPIHKVILESRCEYFEDMFKHDWVENSVGEVTFKDIEEDALDSVLHFLYTGVVEDMSVENVCEIYVAAHKFLLDDLKTLCIEYMKKIMCLEIVCKALVIADTYEERDLNKNAIEYFLQEASKIFDSEEWKELKKNHPSIATELLEESMKREIKKRAKE